MLENSPSAIALDDLRGKRLLANARMADWFPDGLPADLGAADSSLVMNRELEIATGGRARRLLVTRFPVVDGGGSATGVGTIATDMTEQHHAAERLRQSQRLESLGQLTGGIAHDFNNLLSVILGNLRLIEEELGGAPALLELLEEALDATRSGVELTARLLAFGRGQPLHPEVGDMRELVLVISRLIGRTLGESVPVRLSLPAEPCLVQIDRAQLEAALLNLAINARDAMAGSGELVITVRPGPRAGPAVGRHGQ